MKPELAEAALHDPLTGLPNRVLLQRHANTLAELHAFTPLAFVGDAAPTSMLLYIDLDRFKSVNDDYGHSIGDGVLIEFARRLRESCRPNDIAARLAGDEFVLLLVDPLIEAEALTVANRVVRTASVPFLIEDTVVTIGASVGIAAFAAVESGESSLPSLDVLLRRADLAMYRAKNRGRGRAEVFTERTTAPRVTQDRRWDDGPAMGRRLCTAIDEGALALQYQPKVDLVTGQVLEVEVLVDWPQPTGPTMPPAQLAALAERTGLIEPLTEWALHEACRQAAVWDSQRVAEGIAPLMAINVNPAQLSDPAFVELAAKAVSAAGLELSRLCIEIAEPSIDDDPETLVAALQVLRGSGMRLTLDGFGAGISSLTGMRRLPLDWVKIDDALVARVDVEPANAALVRLIIETAHSLGLRVCALSVDRHAQLEQLASMGCDAVQGNLLGGLSDAALVDTRIRTVRDLTAPGAGNPLRSGRGQLTALIDESGRISYVSAESVVLLGYRPSELVGRRVLDLVPPDHRDRASAPFAQRDTTDHVATVPLVRKDGAVVWVDATHTFIRDSTSRALRHLATTAVDVTERVRAEDALARRERRLHSAFDSAPQGGAVLDVEGRLLQVNAALLELFGRTEADVIGHSLHEFIVSDSGADPLSLLQASPHDAADKHTARTKFIGADGSPVPADVTVRLVRDEDGQSSYIVGHIVAVGAPSH